MADGSWGFVLPICQHLTPISRLTLPRVVKHLVHQRAIDGVDRRADLERLRRFRAFFVTDDVIHTAANVVIHDEARIGAHARLGRQRRGVLLAAQRADHQKTSALQQVH